MPAVALLLLFWQKSLQAVYYGVFAGYVLLCAHPTPPHPILIPSHPIPTRPTPNRYVLLCAVLFVTLARLDWDVLAAEANARANGTTAAPKAEAAGDAEPQEGGEGSGTEPLRAPPADAP